MNRTIVPVALLVNILTSFCFEEDRSFPLPFLPDVEYYLEDVIVLPRNADNITVLLVDGDTNLTLNTFNVTEKDGFKLICDNCSVTSINRGHVLITSTLASVYLNISGCIVHILPIKELHKHVYLKHHHGAKIQDRFVLNIYVYPTAANTSIRLCTNHSAVCDSLTNLKPIVNQLPDGQTCYEIKLSQYDGLVLANTSLFDGVDISANDPLGLLVVSVTNISHVDSYNTKEETINQKRWHVYHSFKTTSNQFLPIRPGDDSNSSYYFELVVLNIVAEGNTSVYMMTSGDTIIYNLTDRIPDTIDLTTEGYLYINSYGNLDVYSSLHKEQGYLNIVSLPSNFDNSEINVTNPNFQWIYIHNHTDIVLACASNTNVTFNKLFSKDTITPTHKTSIFLGNKTTRLVQYLNLFEGIYRIRVMPGLEQCGVSIIQTLNITIEHNSVNEGFIVQTYASGQSNFIYETIFYTHKIKTISNVDPMSVELIGLNKGLIKLKRMQYQNESSTLKSSHNDDFDILKKKSYSEEKAANTTEIAARNSSTENATLKHLSPKTINSQFKVALQLTHSYGQWIKDLTETNKTLKTKTHNLAKQSKSNEEDNLKYVIQSVSRADDNEVNDGKSLVAIIISLVAALVSVVLIILFFFLVEYCSNRNQIRKTRIRPFVSYY